MPLKIKPTVLDRLKELEGDAKAKRISEALPILAKNSSKQLVPVDGSHPEDIANFRDTIAVDMSAGYLGDLEINGEDCSIFKSDASYAELEYFGVTMQYILNSDDDSGRIQYAPDIVLINDREIRYVVNAIKTLGLSGTYVKNSSDMAKVPDSYHHGYCPMIKSSYLELSMDIEVYHHSIYIVPKDFAFEEVIDK